VVHRVLATGAHILRDQRGAGHGEPGAERDDQEGDWKADRDRCHGSGAEPADPERVGQLVAGLERVAENDRDGEHDQRRRDRTFEQPAAALGDNRISLLQGLIFLEKAGSQGNVIGSESGQRAARLGSFRLGALDFLAQHLEPEPIFFRRGKIGLDLGELGSHSRESAPVAGVEIGIGELAFDLPDPIVERVDPRR